MTESLYNIVARFRACADLDLPEDDLRDTLEGIEMEITDKAENVVRVIHQFNADAATIEAEIKRLKARQGACEARAAWLKQYLRDCLHGAGMTNLKTPLFTVYELAGRPRVVVDDEDRVPDEYWRVTMAVNKAALLEAFKAGATVPGAHAEVGEPTLVIR